ncbi:MAG TPA: hypothetical protein VF292_07400 [Rhodanobacteraceae bacterium]
MRKITPRSTLQGISRDTLGWLVLAPFDRADVHVAARDAQRMQRQLDALAAQAAEVSAYIGARGAKGTGDAGHRDGMNAAAATRKRVREALGYAYP